MDDSVVTQRSFDRRALLGGGLAVGGAATALLAGAHPALAATAPDPRPGVTVTTLTGDAIQAAIDGLPVSGGTVALVDGTYMVSRSIVLRSGVTLLGASRSGTILQLAPAANKIVIVNADVVNGNPGIAIRSLTIDGNRARQTSGGAVHGIYLVRCPNLRLDDLEVANCRTTGIALSGEGVVTRVGHVSNIYAHDNGYNGINVYHALREIAYTNITCDSNALDGFDLGHSEVLVNGIQCNHNGRDGFRTDSIFSSQLHGITANLNGRYGIALLALIDSVGTGWMAHNNAQKQAVPDIWWDGGVISYGLSEHTVVSGVSCGPVHVSTWGDPYPFAGKETYGLAFASNIVGNVAVLGLYASKGTLGRYLLPPASASSKLLVVEHEPGTPDLRVVRGNLEIAGGDLVHGAGGRVGLFGASPSGKPKVTGAKRSNPALASLLKSLAQLGLVTDATTA